MVKAKARSRPVYRCPMCGGSGRCEMSGVYAETLDLLRAQPAEITGAALAKLAGCRGEAMCNRLVALERHGFAVGRRWGRTRLWTATKGVPDGQG